MLVDTQPATHQHLPASQEVRDQWVDAQLIGVLMDNSLPSLISAMLALPVMAFLMAGEVNSVWLVIWVAVMFSLLVYRYRMVGIYRLQYDHMEGPSRMAFIRRYGWTWAAVGLCWGVLNFEVGLRDRGSADAWICSAKGLEGFSGLSMPSRHLVCRLLL